MITITFVKLENADDYSPPLTILSINNKSEALDLLANLARKIANSSDDSIDLEFIAKIKNPPNKHLQPTAQAADVDDQKQS